MKKKPLFFSAAAAAALALTTAGCSNDELAETPAAPKSIEFGVQNSVPSTRTTATTDSVGLDAFVVYGGEVYDDGNTNLIFEGVTVARQINGKFSYAPKRYFSADASTAGFVAYSPVSTKTSIANANANGATRGSLLFDYELLHPDTLTGKSRQEDLLIAFVKGHPVGTPKVTLNFQHALSRIFVKATNTMDETVVVKSLKLLNVYSQARLGVLTPRMSDLVWGNLSAVNQKDYKYALAETGVAVDTTHKTTPALVTSMEQGMLIIPHPPKNKNNDQIVDAGDFALEVVYDVSNLKNKKKYILLPSDPLSGYQFNSDGSIFTFQPGKQYAITVNFTGSGITFDISVGDFADIENVTQVP